MRRKKKVSNNDEKRNDFEVRHVTEKEQRFVVYTNVGFISSGDESLEVTEEFLNFKFSEYDYVKSTKRSSHVRISE